MKHKTLTQISHHDIMYEPQEIEWSVELVPDNNGFILSPKILTKEISVDSDFMGEMITHVIDQPTIEIEKNQGYNLSLKELRIDFNKKTTIAIFGVI